jgi:hypothetical protein
MSQNCATSRGTNLCNGLLHKSLEPENRVDPNSNQRKGPRVVTRNGAIGRDWGIREHCTHSMSVGSKKSCPRAGKRIFSAIGLHWGSHLKRTQGGSTAHVANGLRTWKAQSSCAMTSGIQMSFWRGRAQDLLTLNQHLAGLGRPPLRKTMSCRGDPLWSPSEARMVSTPFSKQSGHGFYRKPS